MTLLDTRNRPLRDLRISVTDRCNFRCSYCMPKSVFTKDYPHLAQSQLLSFEEIGTLARVFVGQGVQKIRLTGGEPLLRKNLEVLIADLATLRTPSNQTESSGQVLDLTLTTNGSLLAKKAASLRAAGLNRLTVSLDGLDDAVFRAMNDVDFPVGDVLAGIDAAIKVGFSQNGKAQSVSSQIKVNMVVKRGVNETEIVCMARHFRGSGVVLRFIEYMDVGASNGWRMDEVVPSAQVIAQLQEADLRLIELPETTRGETAKRWGYVGADGLHDPALGEVGVISSVSQAFCGDCNRARLSTDGKLYLCLFANGGHDLRALLRENATLPQDELQSLLTQKIAHIWGARTDRYSELRGLGLPVPADKTEHIIAMPRRVEMSYIGG